MALARLATEGLPVACEGDVDGSIGCLVGKLLGCGAVYLSDWLEHDENTLTLWSVSANQRPSWGVSVTNKRLLSLQARGHGAHPAE